jgi:hypothetical protein
MDKLLKAADKAAKHRKSCETCTDHYVCDVMADINADLLKAAISQ